jgi:poly-gamma-glutamate synthesis protein (capsule biosynthesis protein)
MTAMKALLARACAALALAFIYLPLLPALAEPVTVTISAAGDCTLGGDPRNGGEARFTRKLKDEGGDYAYFLRLVEPVFSADDLTVVNLEGPLTTAKSYKKGKQFCFRGAPAYAEILTSGSVELCNLANNHARDFYAAGLEETRDALDAADIGYFGFADTCIREVRGVKVGFAGFYAQERADVAEVLMDLRGQCDIMIASFHGGEEGSNYPTRAQQKLARAAVDAGADLVLGHHPHVLQGLETYAGKTIAYSLGNFCFGGNGNPRDKDTIILRCAFTLEDGALTGTSIDIVPCSVSSVGDTNNFQPMPLEGDAADRVMQRLVKYSKGFDVPGVVAP